MTPLRLAVDAHAAQVFGVGWESMICYHRRMARVFLSVVILHMVFFWVVSLESLLGVLVSWCRTPSLPASLGAKEGPA